LVASAVAWSTPARATPPLHTPWPCDTTYEITQGHNGGSHVDEGAWAWDIGIPQGADVAAPADGVVRLVRMDSQSGGCSSSYANDANYVVLDFGDGTEALFLHLLAGSSTLQVGDLVKQGDVVGKVGLSGWVCGAHLHFQIQSTCSSWWCQSMPAAFVDYGDPGDGASLPSNNCPMLAPCETLDGGETVFDERVECFARTTSYWWSVAEGYQDHHYYTFAIDASSSDTTGRWTFDVATGGSYRVEAFVPQTDADTTAARYQVEPGSGVVALGPVDQSTQKGWITLGELDFVAGSGRWLELGDATGESSDLDRKVAFDAIRFTFLRGGAGAGGSGASGGGASSGSGAGGDAPAGAGGAGGSDDPRADDDALESSGCGCRTVARGPQPGIWLLAMALALGLSRRSRRRPAG
jgi:MYXO-CTERM domain-containing protein